MKILENVPLAPLTTLQVGGPARYFAEANGQEEVCEAVEFARAHAVPWFVLGGGSNVVVSDTGWPGVVLRVAIAGISREPSGSSILFSVGAGEDWDSFVAYAVSLDCAGIECLSGIPGSVGGTPVQNVGAYGQEVAGTIHSVRVYDTKNDCVLLLPNSACQFRYRSSIFNRAEPDGALGRYIILTVTYRLTPGGSASLNYADLQKHFSAGESPPSLQAVRETVRQIRRHKGMLIVAGDEDSRSVGSFFKNPVLSKVQFDGLKALAESKGLEIPNYPALAAQHKISAAWLVEHSGFGKGFQLGRAAISHKHALAIINRGSAHASDILGLKSAIQQSVLDTWGIQLEPEPVFVGF